MRDIHSPRVRGLLALIGFVLHLTACSASPDEPAYASSQDELGGDASPLGPEPRGKALHYPVILAHGFLVTGDGLGSFHHLISEALERDGHQVYRGSVPPMATVELRATYLAKTVDRALRDSGQSKVNIIGHSMGGLDARELVSVLGYGDRVASVTTISTPHRGSALADIALKLSGHVGEEAMNTFARMLGRTYSEVAEDAQLRGALEDLSEQRAEQFYARHPDDPRVYYQSWAGVSSLLGLPHDADATICEDKLLGHGARADAMSALLAPTAALTAHGTQSNDGAVLVTSAKWGSFRGCVPADHADEVGFLAERPLSSWTGFDFVRFYRNIAFDLAARGN